MELTQTAQGYGFTRTGKPLHTPKKNPVLVPSRALAEAVAREWQEDRGFSPKNMPFTAMAFAAIDVIPEHAERMVDALLAYAETDLLFYRSEATELKRKQERAWDPVLTWARGRYDCELLVTEGIMPVEQPAATMARLRAVLEAMPAFEMSAFSVLTQSLSSLMLALAVREGHLTPQAAFTLSRVDEDFQAEQWGEDSVSLARAQEIARDVQMAEKFLRLLGK